MPRTLVGIVYYADDPPNDGQAHHAKGHIFRVVHPQVDDAELDRPAHDGDKVFLKSDGTPHTWTTWYTDPNRVAVYEKVPADDPRLTGLPRNPSV